MPMPTAIIQRTYRLSYGLAVTLRAQPVPTRACEIGETWHPRRPGTLSESERENYERAITAIRLAVATHLLKKPKSDCTSENRDATGQ